MCRLYDDRDETVNHIICKCSKLIQKYAWLGGKGDSLGIMQEIKILPCWKMV